MAGNASTTFFHLNVFKTKVVQSIINAKLQTRDANKPVKILPYRLFTHPVSHTWVDSQNIIVHSFLLKEHLLNV